jgi:lipoprotein NlpI
MLSMKTLLRSPVGSLLVASLLVVHAAGQDPTPPAPAAKSSSDLRAQALSAIQKGESETANQSADDMLRMYPNDARAMRLAGDIYLRTGKVAAAVRTFDRYLEHEPEEMRGLWQRGIALYFIADYKRAAKQFEEHRKVNSNDVENAAWHFLCIAKADSFDKARQMVLPAPGDPRAPMEEVLQMLTTGNTAPINQRVNRLPVDSEARAGAAFYGDFYLGLYADAKGDRKKAHELLSRAAEDAPHHYMGDIARVYAKHLAK